jgi:hypothetical protein
MRQATHPSESNSSRVSGRLLLRSRRFCLRVVAITLAGLCFVQTGWSAATEEFPEYQLKAAFLYNFAKLVTWPGSAFPTSSTPITIGIIGRDPFDTLLRDTIANKTVNGRALSIQHFQRGDDLTQCHILFISASERDRIPEILKLVEGQSVLTVSEVERFAHSGGVINLVVISKNVRFELCPAAAERAGLKINSRLGGLAIIVKADVK